MMNTHFKGLAHVAIYTNDLDNSIAFYEKIGGQLTDRASIFEPAGEKKLVLVDFGNFVLELIQPPTPVEPTEGSIPHIAIYVDNVEQTAAALKAAGVDTFFTEEKVVQPDVFGGCENWFFTGPCGEQIELLKML